MGLIQLIGEMKQKDVIKQYTYWQIEQLTDTEELIKEIGGDLFAEALNTGLETIARKRMRSNSDGRLTAAQVTNMRRVKDLVIMEAITREQGIALLVEKGIALEIVEKHLDGEDE